MFAATVRAPAVVSDHGVLDGALVVQPGQELGGGPVRVRSLAVTVRPDHIRLISVHLVVKSVGKVFLITLKGVT